MFEKTKIDSARKRSASRPNLLETPAGHEVFVKRRYCFAPARRRPIDQLDWGSPAGSRRIARKDGVSKLVQLSLFPPTGGQGRKRGGRKKESERRRRVSGRKRNEGMATGPKNRATFTKTFFPIRTLFQALQYLHTFAPLSRLLSFFRFLSR